MRNRPLEELKLSHIDVVNKLVNVLKASSAGMADDGLDVGQFLAIYKILGASSQEEFIEQAKLLSREDLLKAFGRLRVKPQVDFWLEQ